MIVRCLLRLYEASANSSTLLDSAKRAVAYTLVRSDSGISVTSGEGSNAQNPLPVRNGLSNAYGPGHAGALALPPLPEPSSSRKLAGNVLNEVVSLLASTL